MVDWMASQAQCCTAQEPHQYLGLHLAMWSCGRGGQVWVRLRGNMYIWVRCCAMPSVGWTGGNAVQSVDSLIIEKHKRWRSWRFFVCLSCIYFPATRGPKSHGSGGGLFNITVFTWPRPTEPVIVGPSGLMCVRGNCFSILRPGQADWCGFSERSVFGRGRVM